MYFILSDESEDTGANSKDVKKICSPKKNDHQRQPKLTEYFLRNRRTVKVEGSPFVPSKAPKMVVVQKGTVDLPESSPASETISQKSNMVDKDLTDPPTNDLSSLKDSNTLLELITPELGIYLLQHSKSGLFILQMVILGRTTKYSHHSLEMTKRWRLIFPQLQKLVFRWMTMNAVQMTSM